MAAATARITPHRRRTTDVSDLRVMYLSPTGHLGGAEIALLEMLAEVRRLGPIWPLHLVVGADGPLVQHAAALGVPVTVLPFPATFARAGEAGGNGSAFRRVQSLIGIARASGEALHYARGLKRLISTFRPDLLHSNGSKMHILAAWCGGSTAVVWHLHEYLSPRPITSRLLRRSAAKCRLILANSKSVADDARSVLGSDLRLQVMYNAVDLERFSPSGPAIDLDATCGLPPAEADTIRVGLIGSFARWKGHAVFLQALALVPSHCRIRGYVIGDSIYQTDGSQYSVAELRGLAGRLGLTSTVGFTGFIERPAEAFRALDVVVHASTAPEPFGLVIAEAMACGRPIVVSAHGGAAEIVQPDVDSLTHPPGDASALAARILQLARDPDLRERLGRAGRATAERRFDRARLARELIPSYQHAVRESDGRLVEPQVAVAD